MIALVATAHALPISARISDRGEPCPYQAHIRLLARNVTFSSVYPTVLGAAGVTDNHLPAYFRLPPATQNPTGCDSKPIV